MQIEQFQWRQETGWLPQQSARIGESAQLVLVFGGLAAMQASEALERLGKRYPNAHICGCSTAGEIQGSKVSNDTVAVTAIAFEHTRVQVAQAGLETAADSFAAGRQVARELLEGKSPAHVMLFAEGLQVDAQELLQGANSVLEGKVSVSGGLAADGMRIQNTYVWCDGAPTQRSVVGVGFYGDRLRVGVASTGGWDAFGPDRLLTKARGNVLYEIDGNPALALYKQYLGEHASGLPHVGLMYPLQLRVGSGEDDRLLRTPLAYDEAEQSITFAGHIPENAFARLMIGNIEHLIDAAEIAGEASRKALGVEQIDLAVLFSCVSRVPVLRERIDEEVEIAAEAFEEDTSIAGFYTYGEIAPIRANCVAELHNQTMTVVTMAEL